MFSSGFKLHIIPGYISNIYIAEYEHGMLLFDCGAVNDIKRIEDFCLNEIRRSPFEIKLAVVTHIHPDHSGGAASLRKKYDTAIAAHKEMDLWYSGIGGFIQQTMDSLMMQQVVWRSRSKLERVYFPANIRADFPLRDGDKLPGFEDWEAIHVPGHTSHDMVLFNSKEKLLYASDCVCEVKGSFKHPLPIMFPRQMQESYDKLAALNASTILLAHGQAIHNADPSTFFAPVRELLHNPPSWLARRVKLMSIFSPEWRRQKRLLQKEE